MEFGGRYRWKVFSNYRASNCQWLAVEKTLSWKGLKQSLGATFVDCGDLTVPGKEYRLNKVLRHVDVPYHNQGALA